MPTKALEIFRAGTHTSAAGESFDYDEQSLREMAVAYDRFAGKPAPVVLGHPQEGEHAIEGGFVRGLVAAGRSLYAIAEISVNFVDLVRKGRLLATSAAFYRPHGDARNPVPGVWFLRHFGLLGAVPPAVKGLERLDFSELPADSWEAANGVSQQGVFVDTFHAVLKLPGLSYHECIGLALCFSGKHGDARA